MRGIDVSHLSPVAADPGSAPMLDWIAIDKLVLDDRYQRPLGKANWASILKIANAFSWQRFSPLLLAPVEGGRYAVVDGQHRAHAAAPCGVERVPAVVVHMTAREQASAFAWVNGTVTRVTPLQMFRAALAAGDHWAVQCDAAVEAAGCTLMQYNASAAMRKPGQIFSVRLVRSFVDAGNAAAVTVGLAAMRGYDGTGRVALWTDAILQPWLGAVASEASCRDVGVLIAVLHRRDPFKVLEAATRDASAGGTVHLRTRAFFVAMIRRQMAESAGVAA